MESRQDRMVRLAIELRKLGISHEMTVELLSDDLDIVEDQLAYLQFRKARRKGALLVEAIRKRFSPPKEFFHAKTPTQPASQSRMDEGSEHSA